MLCNGVKLNNRKPGQTWLEHLPVFAITQNLGWCRFSSMPPPSFPTKICSSIHVSRLGGNTRGGKGCDAFFCAVRLLEHQKSKAFHHLQARLKLITDELRKKMHRTQLETIRELCLSGVKRAIRSFYTPW